MKACSFETGWIGTGPRSSSSSLSSCIDAGQVARSHKYSAQDMSDFFFRYYWRKEKTRNEVSSSNSLRSGGGQLAKVEGGRRSTSWREVRRVDPGGLPSGSVAYETGVSSDEDDDSDVSEPVEGLLWIGTGLSSEVSGLVVESIAEGVYMVQCERVEKSERRRHRVERSFSKPGNFFEFAGLAPRQVASFAFHLGKLAFSGCPYVLGSNI